MEIEIQALIHGLLLRWGLILEFDVVRWWVCCAFRFLREQRFKKRRVVLSWLSLGIKNEYTL